ncbi:hypothetical protein A3J91_02185 [Candidatus Peribacteria bacterium RIFOXYC2_FULL_58_10]|nr:MAG: hypothetical protein A3J91_02185 [Candidatus Peribacteria bacterium RIFOXYC2_FULL_58_10]OGJ84026.1 MAG: hypothetical protein A2529_04500 [Candidatus Peribacteria bacterium RIFOXYD2_FULL_58_15]HAS34126.1 hypothetical protein [Candidatus Peribacteria bacterium]
MEYNEAYFRQMVTDGLLADIRERGNAELDRHMPVGVLRSYRDRLRRRCFLLLHRIDQALMQADMPHASAAKLQDLREIVAPLGRIPLDMRYPPENLQEFHLDLQLLPLLDPPPDSSPRDRIRQYQ